jgi:hypothetical protein
MSDACLDITKLSVTAPSFVCRIFKLILEHYESTSAIWTFRQLTYTRAYFCIIDTSTGFDKTLSLDVIDVSVFPLQMPFT